MPSPWDHGHEHAQAVDGPTADLAFALLLAVRRRIVEGDRYVRARRWGGGWAEEELMGEDVSGATLGILGLGGVGRALARRARAFDMRVLYSKRERLTAEDGLCSASSTASSTTSSPRPTS